MTTTSVFINTFTHSVAYVTDKMLASLKNIIKMSGLHPGRFVGQWLVLEEGIKVWLKSRHLSILILEIFNPATNKLAVRWDIGVRYSSASDDDGTFWTDPEAIKIAIMKAGAVPSTCSYAVIAILEPGFQQVNGWGTTTLRSTEGHVKFSVGTTIAANPVATDLSYWKPK